MARAIHWQVPFASLNGTIYTINIYEEDYQGEIITLTGSSSPFVTEEADDADLLTPIRTQSGYINIVSNRDTWLAIIKNGTIVTLVEDDQVLWCGFITKETFSGSVFEEMTEYQIPVHCILTHLQSKKFIVSPFDTPTFAKVLSEALNYLPAEVAPNAILWNAEFCAQNSNQPKFLEHRIQRSNFYNSDEIPEEGVTIESDSTYYDVISEMCKYFGITLCSQAQNLDFLYLSDGKIYKASTSGLANVETSGISALGTITDVSPSTAISIEDLDYMSADNQESVLPPVKDVTITGQINKYEEFDAQYPEETVKEWIEKHTSSINRTKYNNQNTYYLYTREFTKPGTYDSPTSFYDAYSNALVTLKVYGRKSADDEWYIGEITSRDYVETATVSKKVDYNFKNLLHIINETYYVNFGMYSHKAVALKSGSGAINLAYTVSSDGDVPYGGGASVSSSLKWKLRIGDKYWNGSNWTDTECTFTIGWTTPDQGAAKDVWSNRALGDGYDGETGYIIPISANLYGKISLECYGGWPVYFETLTVKYVRKNSNALGAELEQKETIEVKKTTGKDSVEDYEQDCKFATSDNINGYGSILNFSGVAVSSYAYGSQNIKPEEFRANAIKNSRNTPLSVLDIQVKDSGIITNRSVWLTDGSTWTSYGVLAMSRDWRDNILKLKLVEG